MNSNLDDKPFRSFTGTPARVPHYSIDNGPDLLYIELSY